MTLPFPGSGPRTAFALLAIVLLAPVSCRADDVPDGSGGTTPAIVVADAPSLPRSVDALPPIDVDGFEALLDEMRGTPLVVNFWASWCAPCEREIPMLAAAAERHGESIQFLGVDILDTPGAARTFLRRHGVPYPSVFDPTGETRDSVGSLGQPVTVFYGADGEVVAKVDGELGADELTRHLDAITA